MKANPEEQQCWIRCLTLPLWSSCGSSFGSLGPLCWSWTSALGDTVAQKCLQSPAGLPKPVVSRRKARNQRLKKRPRPPVTIGFVRNRRFRPLNRNNTQPKSGARRAAGPPLGGGSDVVGGGKEAMCGSGNGLLRCNQRSNALPISLEG